MAIMDVSITLKNPVCTLCDKTVNNIEQLNVHMKFAHHELDNDIIDRLTDNVKSALIQESSKTSIQQSIKSYSCTECGV